MLAKLTSKNQITLPKAVIEKVAISDYFEVEAVNDSIMLTPVKVEKLALVPTASMGIEAVWRKMEELGITEQDIEDAVQWGRSEPVNAA